MAAVRQPPRPDGQVFIPTDWSTPPQPIAERGLIRMTEQHFAEEHA
jgi:hypothetical protein